MGWKDAPLAQPGPVARPDPVLRPGSSQRPQEAPAAAPSQPAWAAAPLAETPPAPAPKPEEPLSWADVPGKAVENLPSSALEFGKSIVQPFIHPVDTAKAIYDVGYGLASKLHGALGGTQDPEVKAQSEAAADALGNHFVDRYGSMDGFKKAVAKDPVGVMADVSLVLTGGGSAVSRAPGVVGKAGELAQTAGSVIDPLKNVGRSVEGAGKVAANVMGMTTGEGTRSFVDGFNAVRQGNKAFTDNLLGKVEKSDAVDMGERAVTKMGQKRSADYQAGINDTNASTATLDPRPVFKRINDGLKMAMYNGIPRSEDAAKVAQAIDDTVTRFASLPPGQKGLTYTPEMFDAMKQAVGEIRQKTQQGTLERRIADQVYHAIKDEIVKQVPSYAKAMKDYQAASDVINEARRTLSLNDRATTDTTLRKLQSSTRDGVNANFGQRAKLVDELGQFEPDLAPTLAGQALNSWAPKGLARLAASPVVAGYAAMSNPVNLLMLGMASPRLMGLATAGAGHVARGLDAAAAKAGLTPAMALAAARSGYLADTVADPENRLMWGY